MFYHWGHISSLGNLDVGAKVERNSDGTYSVNGSTLPSSVTVVKNPDGSMAIVSTSVSSPLAKIKLPKTAVTNLDGSTTLPQGTTVKENSDGTVTVDGVSLPPGTGVQTLPDGSTVLFTKTGIQKMLPKTAVANPDGSTTLKPGAAVQENSDGSVTVDGVVLPPGTGLKKLPDGSTVLFKLPTFQKMLPETAVANTDGSTTLKPGTAVKENSDGTITVDGVLLPPGTGVKKMPDGSTVLFSSAKLRKVAVQAPPVSIQTNPDGTVSLGSVKLPAGAGPGPDGAIALPKGTKVTRSTDGTMMVDGKPLPPGIGAKVNADGSFSLAPSTTLPPTPPVRTSPDGGLIVGDVSLPKGSSPNIDGSINLPKGANVSKGKDGSVTIDGQKLPAGTTIKTNPDGSMSVVSSLPPPPAVKTSPDGSIQLGDVSLPKGAQAAFDGSITLPKGGTGQVVRNKNGCISIDGQDLPLGTQIRTNSDGSMTVLPPSNNTGFVFGVEAHGRHTLHCGAPITLSTLKQVVINNNYIDKIVGGKTKLKAFNKFIYFQKEFYLILQVLCTERVCILISGLQFKSSSNWWKFEENLWKLVFVFLEINKFVGSLYNTKSFSCFTTKFVCRPCQECRYFLTKN